jgi:dihydrofolate reductase
MQPLRFSINVTLDGCCDHLSVIPDEALHHHAARNIAEAEALLFGRVTYQMMEEAWRGPAETGVCSEWMTPWMLPFAHTMHAAKKYVVSSTLAQVDWNAQLVRGDLEIAVRKLKSEPGKGIFVAGLKLAQALTELRLIDEYEIIVHPRIAGRGPSLFAGLSKHVDLDLVNRKKLGTGAVALQYVLKASA